MTKIAGAAHEENTGWRVQGLLPIRYGNCMCHQGASVDHETRPSVSHGGARRKEETRVSWTASGLIKIVGDIETPVV
jgi:hypothetical protein